MKDLKCGLSICKHNKGYCCNAKSIQVNEKTDCLSYSPDPKNLSLFEVADDFVESAYTVNTKVACSADCVFMKEQKCFANGITVMSEENSKAACLTFIKK